MPRSALAAAIWRAEHRAEVLPFAVCRHIDRRENPYGGVRWSFAGVATPCFCTEFSGGDMTAATGSVRTLGIVRRLVGCFYCGLPCRGDVCAYCSDLPLRDPLVAKARLPLSEAERIAAHGG